MRRLQGLTFVEVAEGESWPRVLTEVVLQDWNTDIVGVYSSRESVHVGVRQMFGDSAGIDVSFESGVSTIEHSRDGRAICEHLNQSWVFASYR